MIELWVNKERTVLVSATDEGEVTVALRCDSHDVWGPPIRCEKEHTYKRVTVKVEPVDDASVTA